MSLFKTLFGLGDEDENPNASNNTSDKYDEDDETEEDYVGVVIHFTPHRTYVYISQDNDIESNSYNSNIQLFTDFKLSFEVSGSYVLLTDLKRNDIDSVLDMYQLDQMGVPIVRISVQ